MFPLLVFAAATLAYWPCVNHGFVALDDDRNFVLNTLWRGLSAESWEWMWGQSHVGHWHPLTWLTFALEYDLWGQGQDGAPIPQAYHRTNLVLHALGATAFYFLALELLRWIRGAVGAHAPSAGERNALGLSACALLAALTWALHPLRTESVAWVTERRDLLSGLLLSLTTLCYLRGVRSGAGLGWLALSLVLYVASLLSKAWGITLPAILLLLDVAVLGRTPRASQGAVSWNRLVVEKLAFGAVALWAAAEAAGAQADVGAVMTLAEHGVLARIAQASYGLCFYVLKTLWPANLSCHYLLDVEFHWDAPIHVAAMVAVAALSLTLVLARRRAPGALTTWLAFVVLVSPVLGVLQSGAQKVADRYTYIAAMPFSVLLAALASHWIARGGVAHASARRRSVTGLALVVGALLGSLAWRQTKVWADSETLFRRAFEVEPDNYFIAHNLAVMLYERRAYEEALEVEKASVAAHPGYGNHQARYTLGLLYQLTGKPQEAERVFNETVDVAPDNAQALREARLALVRRGDQDGVIALYERALDAGERNRAADARRPVLVEVYAEFANLLVQRKEFARARTVWERARAAGAPPARVENGLGRVDLAAGDFAAAEPRLIRAQQYDPRSIDLMLDVCELFVRQGRTQDALTNLDKVLAIQPQHARAMALRREAQARAGAR